ncbi:MAG: hypothetical protein COA59_00165 [Colwellia sp.]|jgi:hypothetical protein|nr:MAG: hypothetical protein COA59_00165 [Colwellia sp.]
MPSEIEDINLLTTENVPESQDVVNFAVSQRLNNSREFNPYMTCSNSEFNSTLEVLLQEMRQWHIETGGSRFRETENFNMLKRIVVNLIFNYYLSPAKYISIPYNRPFYSDNTRYQPLFGGHNCAVNVRRFLLAREYIEVHTGYQDRATGNSRFTRMRANNELFARFNSVHLFEFQSNQYQESIILRDSNKQDEEYYDDIDSAISFWRQDLVTINSVIENSWIDLFIDNATYVELCNQKLNLTRTKLCRIFSNSSFEQHGRFYYGWWLEIPKGYRPLITIDGQQTTELDYTSMNVALLYSERSIPLPSGDLYQVGEFRRSDCKIAFHIMVNTNTRAGAVITLLNEDDFTVTTNEQINNLLDAIEERHTPINHAFHSGSGNRLMFQESRIANLLMLRLAQMNIVSLPIHDGFIIQSQHENLLKQTMIDCFRAITDGNVNVPEPELYPTQELNFETHFDEYSQYYERRVNNE